MFTGCFFCAPSSAFFHPDIIELLTIGGVVPGARIVNI
jgi:hypothetical protein